MEIPFSENPYHVETSQPICKANKLTSFYMIQVFAKNYSPTDCSILLKILYLAPGSSKEFSTNMGFFVQSQIYHLQLTVILSRWVTFFAVFHSPHKVLIPETIRTMRLITKAKTICSQILYVKILVSSFVSFTNSIKVVSITDCYIYHKIF